MAIEDEVRAASEKFYSALNRMLNGDTAPLGDIWSHSTTVTTMHPIGGREVGWDRKIVHHHADATQSMIDVLSRLEKKK